MPNRWGQLGDDGEIHYDAHTEQGKAIASDARFTGACAGTGGGKTCAGPLWFIRQIQQYVDAGHTKGFLGFIVAPTHKILRRATVPTWLDTIKGTVFEGVYTPSRSVYALPDGLGIIWTLSANDPEGLVGGQANAIWLDEGGQCPGAVWEELQQRTGVREGHILVTSTPYRPNWFKTELIDRARAGDPDYAVYSWRSCDNPAYPQKEYDRAKRTLPEQLFKMRYDAQFTSAEGRVYYAFEGDINIRKCSYDPSLLMIVGCDFNVDPMAWVLCHKRGNTLEIFDEIFVHNTNTPMTLDFLYKRYSNHKGGFLFMGDASSRQRKTSATTTDYLHIANDTRFKALGLNISFPDSNPPVLDRLAAVNGKLASADGTRTLFIDAECENTVRELEQTYYKEGTRDVIKTKDGPHITDALGYIVHGIWPITLAQRPRPLLRAG